MKTYWNGELCKARIVRVIVGASEKPTWWCAHLAGVVREAVEVIYGDQVFYMDNEDGSGALKVTVGKGSPQFMHKNLPVATVLNVIQDLNKAKKVDFGIYSGRQWKPWQCWFMNKLDFRYWFCECHYQPPYGKVVMGGCPKHD